jgi:hypothetical protein
VCTDPRPLPTERTREARGALTVTTNDVGTIPSFRDSGALGWTEEDWTAGSGWEAMK